MIGLVLPLCMAFTASISLETTPETNTVRLTDRSTSQVFGLYNAGVSLEVPMVGLQLGMGSSSSPGKGYTFGAALNWEWTPSWVVRLSGAGGEAFGPEVWVQYEEGSQTIRSRQDASWLGIESCIGVSYLFRGVFPTWVPYFGVDGGTHLHGYFYRFDESLKKLEGADRESAVEGWNKNSVNLSYRIWLRLGVRMEKLDWLASSLELGLGFTRIDNANISGTILARNVRGESENLWTLRVVYSVFLGL